LNKAIIAALCGQIEHALRALKESRQLRSENIPPVYLESPRSELHGDLSSNVAMRLAREERRSPMGIAQQIVEALPSTSPARQFYDKVEVAPPGFINFFLSHTSVVLLLNEILQASEDFGRCEIGQGKTGNVEFVSANPTGPLTVGHGRQAIIGDVISSVLSFCGYDVTREYYFNNAGNQMRLLGESVRARYHELLGETVEFPEEGYRGEYIREIAAALREQHGHSLKHAPTEPFQKAAERAISEEINRTLERIGVKFDNYFNEYSLYTSGKTNEVIEKFKELGHAYEKDGALWFRASNFGQEDDRVIVKSGGEPTYRLPDICYHVDKIARKYDLIVDIFGADHQATYPDVLAGVRALGYDTDRIHVLIHQFVTLKRGGEKVKMSTRRATFVTVDDLLDEISKGLRSELVEAYGEDSPQTHPDVLERMSRDAVRFFYNMRKMGSHLDFDLDLATKQTMENPAYYVQYAHARICSIFRVYYQQTGSPEIDFTSVSADKLNPLREEKEASLVKNLARFPRLVEDIATKFEGHRLNEYLLQLATSFQSYYNEHRVISDDPDLTLARLCLIRAVQIVLRNALSLLGVSAPETM
jgi:arginyl-tRNA synthetase